MKIRKLVLPLVLVDTEYTCFGHSLKTAWWKPWQHKEIVQIGAVKLDEAGNEIDVLNTFVIPKINPKLSNRFSKLTGISQDDVDKYGISFSEALQKFVEFSKGLKICTFDSDYIVFRENCIINDIIFPYSDQQFIKLCEYLDQWGIDRYKYSSGTLYKAVGEEMYTTEHNALHDVRSMGVVIKKKNLN